MRDLKNYLFVVATICLTACWSFTAFGQPVSDEARLHYDRGVAAVEMAKSPTDYEAAIKEFKQAIDLAPDWADAYYDLGNVQAQAEKFADAVASFKQYLRLAPNASDVASVKSLINKLEYKAENTLTKADQGKAGDVVKNKIGMEMVWIPAGTFMMGSENSDADEMPMHRVTISNGFWMGKYEVTQGQGRAVMGTTVWQQWQQREKAANAPGLLVEGGADYPISFISWDDAQEFIRKLNARNDGYTYRLPTEAEWEYAARAGTTGDHYGNIDSIAWYQGNVSAAGAHPVGQKQANAFGLFDMSGNVMEWVEDWRGSYSAGAATDPTGPSSGNTRVLRGGSWFQNTNETRSAYRYWNFPSYRLILFGFRVVAVRRQ